jgi:hypothetical protein
VQEDAVLRLALLFVHVLSIITFFLGHGAGCAMAFRLCKETSLERIQAMLDLSGSTLWAYLLAYLLLGITGITNGFLIRAWNKGWLWLAIVLMLFVFFWMYWFNERH